MKKEWFINAIIIILSIIAIILIYVFAQTTILKKSYASLFGYSIFKVQTGSMEDTIAIGDIIVVKLDEPFKENDIVTFKENDYLITHRVITIEDDYIITKGDNNNAEDEPITKEDVIGKVVYIFNNINVWKQVFAEPKVIICLFITSVLFITLIFYSEPKQNRHQMAQAKTEPSPNGQNGSELIGECKDDEEVK